jgi:uncharacterized protein (TIGR03083 family)
VIHRPGPNREQTIDGLLAEYRSFADLIDTIDDSAWKLPTRCTGWEVRDVAGHVVGQASDVLTGTLGTRTADEQAADLRGHSATALAAELRNATDSMARLLSAIDDAAWEDSSPIPGLTVGQGVHILLSDAYLHGDDIRAALGLSSDRGPALHASLDGVLGVLARDDVAAADPRIAAVLAAPIANFTQATGIDAYEFLLVASGRRDPAHLGFPQTVNIYR